MPLLHNEPDTQTPARSAAETQAPAAPGAVGAHLAGLAGSGYEAQAAALAPGRAAEGAPVQGKAESAPGTLGQEPPEAWTLATVQRLLATLGLDPGPIDGLMGPRTQAAMRAFLGLPAGAPVAHDASFRRRLQEASSGGAGGAGAGGAAAPELGVWDLRTVQSRLAELGYDPGPIDGLMGPRTQAAMAALMGLPAGARVADDGVFRARLSEALVAGRAPVEADEAPGEVPAQVEAPGDEGGGTTVELAPPDVAGGASTLEIFVASEGDEYGTPNLDTAVAGAAVEVLRADGAVDAVGTTGADGVARVQHGVVGPGAVRVRRGAVEAHRELVATEASARVGVAAPDPNALEVFVSSEDYGGDVNMDAPVAGATVELLRPDGSVVTAGVSGADGRVTLMNTYVGPTPGAVRATRGDVVATLDGVYLDATRSLAVAAPDPNAVEVFVSSEDLDGVANMDAPVAGATVELLRPDGSVVTAGVSGPDGKVTLMNTFVGRVPGAVRATRGDVVATRDGVLLGFTRSLAVVTPDPNALEVFVSAEDVGGGVPDMDAPVAGATVELLRPDGSVATAGVSGADGRVTLMNTVQGAADIRVSRAGRLGTRHLPHAEATLSIGVALSDAQGV